MGKGDHSWQLGSTTPPRGSKDKLALAISGQQALRLP
jgi:hypothetical protein